MGQVLPRAVTKFGTLKNSQLVVQSQSIHDGLVAAVADFPTPTVPVADLQTYIDDYTTALTASIDGSKEQRSVMHKTRLVLKNALRTNANYVNQLVSLQILSGVSYPDASNLILSTGYELFNQSNPAGVLPSPVPKKFGSPAKGQFYMLLIKVPNAKGYEVRLTDLNGDTSVTLTFSRRSILITGLISGHLYNAQLASIGANNTRTFDTQIDQVIQ